MPAPSVEPMPWPSDESRLDVPLDAHEASYLAASARMMSLRRVSMTSRKPCRPVILYESPVYVIRSPTQAPAGEVCFFPQVGASDPRHSVRRVEIGLHPPQQLDQLGLLPGAEAGQRALV